MISILIPTAARPDMLRTALQSVANQTALAHVGRIFVSENGGDRRSEEVCAAFPDLPITYVFREPLSAMEHGRIFFKECAENDYTAILHDDDWWCSEHLQRALDLLESNPDAVAYNSGHYVVENENSLLNCDNNLFAWFGSDYGSHLSPWILSKPDVLLGLLLGTTSHYSTLVARTEKFKAASSVFDLGNPYDNDRMLTFALSTQGKMIYHPQPGVFIRRHNGQDFRSFPSAAAISYMCKTTEWMIASSGKPWLAVAKAFAKRIASCPAPAANVLQAAAMVPWCVPELAKHVDGLLAPAEHVAASPKAASADVTPVDVGVLV